MKLILLVNVKIPTIVGFLTFMSRINTTSESFKERHLYFERKTSFFFNILFLLAVTVLCYNLGERKSVVR